MRPIAFLSMLAAVPLPAFSAAPAPRPAFVPGVAQAARPCAAPHLCGFVNPEDIAPLDGTDWLVVSQQAAQDASTGLVALNVVTGAIVRPAIDAGAPCVANARGGGIGIRREPGGYRLLRVVHPGSYQEAVVRTDVSDGIEQYRVTIAGGKPVFARTGCTLAPQPLFLNDVAVLPDGGLVATQMFDRSVPKAEREAAFLAGRPTGHVMRRPAAGARCRTATATSPTASTSRPTGAGSPSPKPMAMRSPGCGSTGGTAPA